jgi:hypothetical protein
MFPWLQVPCTRYINQMRSCGSLYFRNTNQNRAKFSALPAPYRLNLLVPGNSF